MSSGRKITHWTREEGRLQRLPKVSECDGTLVGEQDEIYIKDLVCPPVMEKKSTWGTLRYLRGCSGD